MNIEVIHTWTVGFQAIVFRSWSISAMRSTQPTMLHIANMVRV